MKPFFQTIRDLESNTDLLRARPYGVIEVAGGRLVQIKLKPWPKIATVVEAKWISGWKNSRRSHDVCRLYFNQPRGHRNYLILSYVESTPMTRWASVLRSMWLLDRIAFIKRSDAILTELSNEEISDRLMSRLGYVQHREHDPRRHWIKRFYGDYPAEMATCASVSRSQ